MKRSGLTRNPAAIRDWLQRSRAPLKRTAGLERKPPARKATIPPAVRALVRERSRGVCVMCLHRVGAPADGLTAGGAAAARLRGARSVAHLHHLLEERNFPRWVVAPDNLVGVCEECHDEHERAHRRIPWEALPAGVQLFLRTVASTDGAAYRAVRTNYPGAAGADDQEDR